MKKLSAKIVVITVIAALSMPAAGQDIGGILQDLAQDNAQGFLGPLGTAFGTGLNSGTFRTAKPHKILGLDVTVNITLIAIPDEALEFEFIMPSRPLPLAILSPIEGGTILIDVPLSSIYESGHMAPTFFGSGEYTQIPVDSDGANTAIIDAVATSTGLSSSEVESTFGSTIATMVGNLPAFTAPVSGIDIPLWFTLMPQFSLGLPFDTELTLRGGSTSTDEGDKIKFGGFGVKVGVNQFIPTIPLVFPAISIGYYATSFEIGDMIKAKNSILTLQVSKSVPVLTVYGGFGIESSSIDVDYTQVFDDPALPDVPIKFSLEGDNSFRTILGFRIKLLLLSINYDYNIGEYAAHNLGFGLTFR